jgi:hypothetical protein
MSSHWWRAYDEAIDDPKLQRLPIALFKHWFNVMCIASRHNGTLPEPENIAFKLRVSLLKAQLIISALMAAGLLDRKQDGTIEPHNWQKRQYKSDLIDPTAAERMRRYRRNAHRNAHRNGTVTRLRPDTDTDTERKKEKVAKEKESGARESKARKGSRLAPDWYPSDADLKFAADLGLRLFEVDNEANKFVDYWKARAGPGGVKRDWSATWRNWCRKAHEDKGKGNGSRLSIVDAGARLIAAEKARTGNCTGPLLDLTPAGSTASHPPARPLPER